MVKDPENWGDDSKKKTNVPLPPLEMYQNTMTNNLPHRGFTTQCEERCQDKAWESAMLYMRLLYTALRQLC
jgi:hypothetical protein